MGLSRKHVTEACNQALKRLQVEYLDLYFCHRADPDTPIGETVWAMHNLITQGKILYWGTSEWAAHEIEEAYKFALQNNLTPPTMEQPQYNLLDRERFEIEYKPIFDKYNIGTTIWSPLASGALTGKYLEGVPEGSRASLKGYEWLRKHMIDSDRGQERMKKVSAYIDIAKEHVLDPTRLAVAWCLLNKNVSTVILGASNVNQLENNLKSSDYVENLKNQDLINSLNKL
jgi:aryl-alcohol dehydrogenase-like predicted oxidoreductase